jgi:hypothetical protein
MIKASQPFSRSSQSQRNQKSGEEKMSDVVEVVGVCEAEKCKRRERRIFSEADKVTVREKIYHRGCEPTEKELKAKDKSVFTRP